MTSKGQHVLCNNICPQDGIKEFHVTHFFFFAFKGRPDVDSMTFIDHMTIIIEYIVICNKLCKRQVVESLI